MGMGRIPGKYYYFGWLRMTWVGWLFHALLAVSNASACALYDSAEAVCVKKATSQEFNAKWMSGLSCMREFVNVVAAYKTTPRWAGPHKKQAYIC